MENYEYTEVNRDDTEENDKIKRKYFLRQAFVFSTMWSMCLVNGMAIGAPTVFIPQLRKEHNSTDYIDDSMSSWIMCIFNFAAAPWVILLPILASYLGRKIPWMLTIVAMLAGSILFYCSQNVIHIVISLALNAIVNSALDSIGGGMIITEYMSPKYRGTFLTLKSATFFWGIWVSNAIGTFFHWRYIPLVMIIFSIYPSVTIYFWPESPYYLANKSKFDACIRSHRWLKGTTKLAEKELSKLLSSCSDPVSEELTLREVICSKRFYKATLLCIGLLAFYAFTGKLACTMYSIDIIKKITLSEKTAYIGMLILDGVTVFGMFVGSMLTRVFRRRVFLFWSTSIGIASLLITSAYVYFVKISVIFENNYISIALLCVYSISIGCGPMILCLSLCGELLPLKYKGLAISVIVCVAELITGAVIKMTPLLMKTIGLYGTFLFFGLSSTIFLWLLLMYMPETKDKTLFEISDMIYG